LSKSCQKVVKKVVKKLSKSCQKVVKIFVSPGKNKQKSELSGDKEKLEKRRNDQDRLTEKLGIRRPYATSSHLVTNSTKRRNDQERTTDEETRHP
jgi:uncharacterized membrane protein YgaE (UPF0421/DUF939 family)